MEPAYIAGFFDGEGNINKILVKGRIYYQIRVYQAGDRGKALLESICQYLGYGNLYLKRGGVWELSITSKKNQIDFKNRVGKFCIIKDFGVITE